MSDCLLPIFTTETVKNKQFLSFSVNYFRLNGHREMEEEAKNRSKTTGGQPVQSVVSRPPDNCRPPSASNWIASG